MKDEKNVYLKASFTIEMSVIAPVMLIIMLFSVMTVFYEHDKAVISAAAYETATVGSNKMREKELIEPSDLQNLFKERVGKKCILFARPSLNVSITDREIIAQGSAVYKRMKVSVIQKAVITKPEEYIRKKRRW